MFLSVRTGHTRLDASGARDVVVGKQFTSKAQSCSVAIWRPHIQFIIWSDFVSTVTARKTPEQHAKILATLPYTASEMELLASFQYGARSSRYRFQFNMQASYLHVRVTRRATDACQIGKERVLSAGLSLHIQSEGFATKQTHSYFLIYISALHHTQGVHYSMSVKALRQSGSPTTK